MQLPVAIDYPAALALRQMSMVHDELLKYLLAPEVSALLHYAQDLRRKMLRGCGRFPGLSGDETCLLKNKKSAPLSFISNM